jgi:Na+-driven multidrug efflux pump
MRLKNVLASVAAAGLVVAQPALAATRSADSLPSSGLSPASVERLGAAVGQEEELRGGAPLRALLIISAVFGISLALLLAVFGDDTPGG